MTQGAMPVGGIRQEMVSPPRPGGLPNDRGLSPSAIAAAHRSVLGLPVQACISFPDMFVWTFGSP